MARVSRLGLRGHPGIICNLTLLCDNPDVNVGNVIVIRFPDEQSKRSGMGALAGRFSFKSWASGEMMVPKEALAFLADQGIRFSVEGPATHERLATLRNPVAAEV